MSRSPERCCRQTAAARDRARCPSRRATQSSATSAREAAAAGSAGFQSRIGSLRSTPFVGEPGERLLLAADLVDELGVERLAAGEDAAVGEDQRVVRSSPRRSATMSTNQS